MHSKFYISVHALIQMFDMILILRKEYCKFI